MFDIISDVLAAIALVLTTVILILVIGSMIVAPDLFNAFVGA